MSSKATGITLLFQLADRALSKHRLYQSSGAKLWCRSRLMRAAGAMGLAMGLVAPTGVAFAKVTTDSYVQVHDRWAPNQEPGSWVKEAHAPRIAHVVTNLGSGQAVARIRNTKGKPNAAPTLVSVVEMEISGDEKKSSSEFNNRNIGHAHARAFVEIEEEITFTQKTARPAKSISFSLVVRGRLQAYAPR